MSAPETYPVALCIRAVDFAVLARAGFRAALEYLRDDLTAMEGEMAADREEIAALRSQVKRCHGIMQGLSSAIDPDNCELSVLQDAAKELDGKFCPGDCTTACDKTIAEQAEVIARLKADQSDWRKGVGLIASALGIDSLSCVDIAERGLEIRAERDALKAEVERLKASVRLACSEDTERAARLIRMAKSGNTVKPADDSGTGRAR